jgi:PAS domain S-box-containing protein
MSVGGVGLAAALVLGAATYLGLAAYVWRHREVPGARPLTAMLISVGIWTTCYALELDSTEIAVARVWSGLKYVGIVTIPPSLWAFVLRYTGRQGTISRRILALMLVEPVVVLLLLAIPATDDLIHTYRGATWTSSGSPVAALGPLFWPHAAYTYVMMLSAVAVLATRLLRVTRLYRRQAWAMVATSVLPFVGNLLYNLEVFGPGTFDPTPFLFTLTAVVLVWGLFRLRLIDLMPVARGLVVEQMADGVLVLDVFGKVADVNPAGAGLLGLDRALVVGRAGARLLPAIGSMMARHEPGTTLTAETVTGAGRDVALSLSGVQDGTGRQTALVVVLRDITDRKDNERRVADLLDEQTRLADALRQSLEPPALPAVPGLHLAARSVPAGRGGQVSGDFYDVHPCPGRTWAFVLGDVSGKGAQAAVVTSMTRYTVRTLSAQGLGPQDVLRHLNRALLATDDVERYCTVVYGQLEPIEDHGRTLVSGAPAYRGARVRLSLGGHPRPLVRRRGGHVEAVGTPGTALGLLPSVEVRQTVLDLAPGDVLLAFTDGVTEAGGGREQFGEERLAAVLTEAGAILDPLEVSVPTGGGRAAPVAAVAATADVDSELAARAAETIAARVLGAVEAYTLDRDDVALLVLVGC